MMMMISSVGTRYCRYLLLARSGIQITASRSFTLLHHETVRTPSSSQPSIAILIQERHFALKPVAQSRDRYVEKIHREQLDEATTMIRQLLKERPLGKFERGDLEDAMKSLNCFKKHKALSADNAAADAEHVNLSLEMMLRLCDEMRLRRDEWAIQWLGKPGYWTHLIENWKTAALHGEKVPNPTELAQHLRECSMRWKKFRFDRFSMGLIMDVVLAQESSPMDAALKIEELLRYIKSLQRKITHIKPDTDVYQRVLRAWAGSSSTSGGSENNLLTARIMLGKHLSTMRVFGRTRPNAVSYDILLKFWSEQSVSPEEFRAAINARPHPDDKTTTTTPTTTSTTKTESDTKDGDKNIDTDDENDFDDDDDDDDTRREKRRNNVEVDERNTVEKAIDYLLTIMPEDGVPPSLQSYSYAVIAYLNAGKPEKAEDLFEHIMKQKHAVAKERKMISQRAKDILLAYRKIIDSADVDYYTKERIFKRAKPFYTAMDKAILIDKKLQEQVGAFFKKKWPAIRKFYGYVPPPAPVKETHTDDDKDQFISSEDEQDDEAQLSEFSEDEQEQR